MSIRDDLYQAGVDKDWNTYRTLYPMINIDDLIYVNTEWDSHLPCQDYAQVDYFREMFWKILGPKKVVELGCHRGKLATEVLKINHNGLIKCWHGYDINHKAIDDAYTDSLFEALKLQDWFWNTYVDCYDTFVCAHTLEHMAYWQVLKIFVHVQRIPNLLLEIPFGDWHNFRGGHVAKMSRDAVVKDLVRLGYEVREEHSLPIPIDTTMYTELPDYTHNTLWLAHLAK